MVASRPTISGPPSTVLVVGAGEFGAATALSLAKGPYKGYENLITIIDRAVHPPAEDAASSDYNKIIRQDYSDPFYAKLACEAMTHWRGPEYRQHFHESGITVSSKVNDVQAKYVKESFAVNLSPEMKCAGKRVYELKNAEECKAVYPDGIEKGKWEGYVSYKNEAGGWADSRGAVVDVLDRVRRLGVRFGAGEADQLLFGDVNGVKDVRGVRTKEGDSFFADLIILATGAWTSTLLPELATECLPTGQTVATIHLTPEETKLYADIPVSFFLDTGFYCFPPNKDGVLKLAIHDRGWIDPAPHLSLPSIPRTSLTLGYEKQEIPPTARRALKECIARLYPGLANKPFAMTRLCWYTDRPSGDFLFDFHPAYKSLFVASGGSGHGFKFLPIIGNLILRSLQGELTPQERSYWGFFSDTSRIDKSRGEEEPVRKILLKEYSIRL
ncbi:FAD dependent oxidoreductase [Meredithblackwellia eburnea MCA 4105]